MRKRGRRKRGREEGKREEKREGKVNIFNYYNNLLW